MIQSKTGSKSFSIADILAPVMFLLSLVFLGLLATLIVVWVDIPRFSLVSETVTAETAAAAKLVVDPITESAARLGGQLVTTVWILGFIIVAEVLVLHFLQLKQFDPDDALKWRLLALAQVICPPLRLAAPSLEMEGKVWLPWLGWKSSGRKLFRLLESVFSKPMLFFALLILPVLLIEFGLHSFVETHHWLRITMHVCTGLIWCAFALEFIILFNVSDKKLAFVKKHWIDLAIVLLPIIMFLRSLRALRLMKVAKFARVQQLTNLSRAYRVRGVAMKAVRALLVLEVFTRMIPIAHEKKLKRLKKEYSEKLEDLEELQVEIDKVKLQIEKQTEEQTSSQALVSSDLPPKAG